MGSLDDKELWRSGQTRSGLGRCPKCGLMVEAVPTDDVDMVLLEPDFEPLAHTVPPEQRWIILSDGRATVYGTCPRPEERCRIAHRLACPDQDPQDLWPWLTTLREETLRRAQRLF